MIRGIFTYKDTHTQDGARNIGHHDPDAAIVKDLAKGDPTALERLMKIHLTTIKSTAWHMVGDEMIAEDIAQDVFIKAWKQAPHWEFGKAKFSTWLHRVTKNLCYDRLRATPPVHTHIIETIEDDTPLASQTIVTQETRTLHTQHLQLAMDALPQRQKMAITLCHYQGKSQKEAASIMEISVHAYESLLARARRNLHKTLRPHKTKLLSTLGDLP